MKAFRVLSFSLNFSLFTIDLMFDGIIFQIKAVPPYLFFVSWYFEFEIVPCCIVYSDEALYAGAKY